MDRVCGGDRKCIILYFVGGNREREALHNDQRLHVGLSYLCHQINGWMGQAKEKAILHFSSNQTFF